MQMKFRDKIDIPSGVETVKYRSMIKTLYDEEVKDEDPGMKWVLGMVGVAFLPLLIVGESCGAVASACQNLHNSLSAEEIKFLQCSIAILKYLEGVNALAYDRFD